MGLHPQAIAVFMLLVLDLLCRGYKVVISTHSPLVLDIVWAIRRLGENNARWYLLSEAFGATGSASIRKVMEHALKADYRVFFLEIDSQSHRVTSRVLQLDPDSSNDGEAILGGG